MIQAKDGMSKVLFVIPPVRCTNDAVSSEDLQNSRSLLLLGVPYVAAAARAAGHSVEIFDTRIAGKNGESLEKAIRRFRPTVAGIPCYTYSANSCQTLAARIKNADPAVRVVLGGPHASIFPAKCMGPHVDAIIIGEGEKTFCEYLEGIGSTAELRKVKGIWFKTGSGGIIKNPRRAFIGDLDSLAPPALDLYPVRCYSMSQFMLNKRVVSMITSRGCPYSCTFCASALIWGRKLRFHSADRVAGEMNSLYKRYGFDAFEFNDDTFTIDRERTLELCRVIRRKRLAEFSWMCYTRADRVDPALLTAMKRAGCRYVYYGCESGSQRILDLIKKGLTVEQNREAIRLTRKAGMWVGVGIILGFPTETVEDTEKTIEFVLKERLDQVCFNIMEPFPGTGIWRDSMKNGRYCQTSGGSRVWVPKGRSLEELKDRISAACKAMRIPIRLVG